MRVCLTNPHPKIARSTSRFSPDGFSISPQHSALLASADQRSLLLPHVRYVFEGAARRLSQHCVLRPDDLQLGSRSTRARTTERASFANSMANCEVTCTTVGRASGSGWSIASHELEPAGTSDFRSAVPSGNAPSRWSRYAPERQSCSTTPSRKMSAWGAGGNEKVSGARAMLMLHSAAELLRDLSGTFKEQREAVVAQRRQRRRKLQTDRERLAFSQGSHVILQLVQRLTALLKSSSSLVKSGSLGTPAANRQSPFRRR